MPVTTSYPGVYIDEIPSGSTTIVGVATSITAFLGRAPRGPANEPITIFSFADYQRTFGGLHRDSTMSYAVRDFYSNGGRQAVVVRLFSPDDRDYDGQILAATEAIDSVAAAVANASDQSRDKAIEAIQAANDAVQASTVLPAVVKTEAQKVFTEASAVALTTFNQVRDKAREVAELVKPAVVTALEASRPKTRARINLDLVDPADGTLVLLAKQPGPTMAKLRARVDYLGHTEADIKAQWLNAENSALARKRFNLSIRDDLTEDVETFGGVSSDPQDARYVASVLREESLLVKVSGDVPSKRPKAHEDVPFGDDPFDDTKPARYSAQVVTTLVDCTGLAATDYVGDANRRTGLYALKGVSLFNILYIPPDKFGTDLPTSVHTEASAYCVERRAFYLIDGRVSWDDSQNQFVSFYSKTAPRALANLGVGASARNAAVFLPRVRKPDPLRQGRLELFPPGGMIAGIMARTDAARGVWKAPAGLEASLNGAVGLAIEMSDDENGVLNPLGLNCLRSFPVTGNVVWGTRTGRGADQLGDNDNRYIPVRRLTLYIEESLYRGTQFAVFEPNGKALWGTLRLAVAAFMQDLYVQGAFYSYTVRCDATTTTPRDIELGRVNVEVIFLPVKPAEFVIIKIQQQAQPGPPQA